MPVEATLCSRDLFLVLFVVDWSVSSAGVRRFLVRGRAVRLHSTELTHFSSFLLQILSK